MNREHHGMVETGRAMLALWSGGVLQTLKAVRANDQDAIAELERNALHALSAAKGKGS
jgi:hypothetical protein